MGTRIPVNRTPVLTLWATVVAQQLGFEQDEALSLGRAVAGLNAFSKGVRLDLFEPMPEAERQRCRTAHPGETVRIDLLCRAVPAVQTPDGLRALRNDKPIDPASVKKYLRGRFGDELNTTTAAMERLAGSLPPDELARLAYHLYERFCPALPSDDESCGPGGTLDIKAIDGLLERD